MNTQQHNLEHLVGDFLIAKQVEGKSPATVSFYKQNLERFLSWLKYDKLSLDVREIDVRKLRAFLAHVQNTPKRCYKKRTSLKLLPSMATLDAYWRTLQALFSWLVTECVIDADISPMKTLVRPKVPKKVIQDIPLELIKNAIDIWDEKTLLGARNRAIILVLLDTGIRVSECAGITLADIRLGDGLIKVTGKGKQRLVRLGEVSRKALNHYLTLRETCESESIWIRRDGQPFRKEGIQTMIHRLRKLGGNVRWSPHTFRNTFSINYLRSGGDPFTLQILGGWEDLEMPRRYCAALKVEDAFAVHRKASPADQMKRFIGITE
jgi:site-specific recombinase XerD